MRPVGGMVAMLMNVQWQTAKTNSARCRIPAFDASVILTERIRWIPDTDVRGPENHCWMVWDCSRKPGPARLLFADPNAESEPETRWCIVCRKPLPLTARADKRHCSPDAGSTPAARAWPSAVRPDGQADADSNLDPAGHHHRR